MATKLQEKNRCERDGRDFVDNTLVSIGQTSEKQHYVKNIDLYNEIVWCKEHNVYFDASLGKDVTLANDKLASMFLQIASKLANKLVFPLQEDREDVIYTAVGDCIKYFENFDPEVSKNAFAYITSICTNGFAKGWRSLGYMKLPLALRMSTSDNLYSI